MSEREGIVRGDSVQRVASAAFIVGAILLAIFNVLVPRPADPSDLQGNLISIADQFFLFQFSHLMLALGILGVMIGAAGVDRSITDRGAAWARPGLYSMVVGTVLFSVTFAVTSVEATAAADWVAASMADKATAYSVAAATINVGKGMYIMSILIFWLALVFLGAGMARSAVYPGWLGWVAVVLGIAMVATVGIPQFLAGTVTTSSIILFVVLAILTIIWFLVVGIWIARRAW
jgi:hypothetical protein